MAKRWTDAEYEFVDARGRRWRYRPPRLNRWQFFAALCAGAFALHVVLVLADFVAHRLGLY